MGFWKTSNPHTSKDSRIGRHVDVERFESRGHKDHGAGKMKISRNESKPLVRDINPSSHLSKK